MRRNFETSQRFVDSSTAECPHLEAVVLHGVHVVLHPDEPPLVLGVLVLVAGPDLLEVGHDVVPALHHHLQAVAARLDDAADLSH